MRTPAKYSRGFTLIEIAVSIVAFGILMVLMARLFSPQLIRGTDPLYNMRAAELGQSYLEEILGKRFSEISQSGNQFRCGENNGPGACSGLGLDANESGNSPNTFDDVDDYITTGRANVLDQNGASRSGYDNFSISINVSNAGGDVGLNAGDAKRIDVTIFDPSGGQYLFTAYKTNF